MKTSNLMIHIPEPCHEDWNNMQPDAKGKYCNSCGKSVFDFSAKTDHQIHAILLEHKDEKVCGRFHKAQVNRPLNLLIHLRDLPGNISTTRAFAIAIFLVFGTFLFSCTNEQGQKVDTIEVVTPGENRMTLGEPMFVPPVQITDTVPAETGIEEEYLNMVAGGIQYDSVLDSVVTLKEVPVIANTEPMIDHVIMGAMSYVILDSTRSDEHVGTDSAFSTTTRMSNNSTINNTTGLMVYPNPSNGEFSIKYNVLKRSDVSLVIYDMNGTVQRSLVNMNKQYEGKYEIPVNLSDLPNGIYIVSMINEGKRTTERLVIER